MLRSAGTTTDFERPYPPGWFDRLTDWAGEMPGPNALYCLGLLVFQFGYVTAFGRTPQATSSSDTGDFGTMTAAYELLVARVLHRRRSA